MASKNTDLRSALVNTLLDIIDEQKTETPAAILSVARSYLRDVPMDELESLNNNGTHTLKEILETLPFDEEKAN